jgi:Sec-independent protein translocase protein TatA
MATIPLWLEIVLGATAAAGAGTSIYSAVKQGQAASDAQKQQQQMLQQSQQQAAAANQQAQQKAVLANLANAQAQGGGFLPEQGQLNLASVVAGMPGAGTTASGQGALAQYLGTGAAATAPTEQNVVGSTYGLSGSQG